MRLKGNRQQPHACGQPPRLDICFTIFTSQHGRPECLRDNCRSADLRVRPESRKRFSPSVNSIDVPHGSVSTALATPFGPSCAAYRTSPARFEPLAERLEVSDLEPDVIEHAPFCRRLRLAFPEKFRFTPGRSTAW
jgi:hypothetical protein